MLALLVASLLSADPAPALELVPHDGPKKRTELLEELSQFEASRPSIVPGVVAAAFGVAAELTALFIDSKRYTTGAALWEGRWVQSHERILEPVGEPELGFAIGGAALLLAGALWELYVGVDRWRGASTRDGLITAIVAATR